MILGHRWKKKVKDHVLNTRHELIRDLPEAGDREELWLHRDAA